MRFLRRWSFWLWALPLLLVMLIMLVLGVAVSTNTGLDGLLALAQRLLPGQLSYQRIEGRLIGPLQLEKLRYTDGPLQIAAERAELEWNPSALFNGLLKIDRLHVDGLDVRLPPGEQSPAPAEPFSLPDIQLPLAVQIADLQGRNLRIHAHGAAPVVIDAVNLQAQAGAEGLNIDKLDLRSPLGDARINGQVNPVGDYPLHLQLAWRLPLSGYGDFHGQGQIHGALRKRLEFTHQIDGLASIEFSGDVRDLFTQPAWSAQARLNVTDLKPFVAEMAGQPLSARMEAQGVLARFKSSITVETPLPQLGPSTLHFVATGDDQSLQLDSLKLSTAQHPLALNAHGQLQLSDLRFNLAGQWQSLAWPLSGPPEVESNQGQWRVEGIPTDYRFQLAADLKGRQIPQGNWTLTGLGSDQAVREVEFTAKTLEGVVQGKVDARWLPTVGWQATINGEGVNPGAKWPDMPGKLNLRLKSVGSLGGEQLKTNLLLEELAGTLKGQALRGQADVSVQNQDLTIKALRLSAGANRLEAEGTLAQRWDLRWILEAPQLQALVPGLSGAISSTGDLSGLRERPQIATRFTVNNLRQGDTQIRQLKGEARIDAGGKDRSQLKMTGEGLMLGGQRWKTVTVDGAGTPAAHELQAELAGEPGRFTLALVGQLAMPELNWQGRITRMTAGETLAGNWNLEQAVGIQASARQARLDKACLASTPTRLCVQGQWSATQGGTGQLQLTGLNPERFKSLLPKGVDLATRINADASATTKPSGVLQARLNLDLTPGTLNMVAEGRPIHVTLKAGSVLVNLDNRTATAQARLDLAQTGQLQANVQVQNPLGAARVNGKINAAILDLGIVSLFAPQVQNVSGQLRADVDVSGDLAKLALRGAIRLENAGAALPEAGIRLENLQMAATSNGRGPLQVTGSVRSGPGQMRLTGEIDPLKPHLDLTIKGQDFQAVDTSDVRLQLSPDLNITFDAQQLRAEGQVTIPRAFLRPGGNRPGAVKASEDVVIIHQNQGAEPAAKAPGLGIFAKVRVILGDDVQLETPAFKGKLKGSLLVEETPQLAPRGSGKIEVVAGNYKIYGEEVEIQRGQVLFSNSPLDNPGLDLRVARGLKNSALGDDASVGAQVRGTLKQPKLTLFSLPKKLPDADILSYLLFGRASQGGGSESALLFKAANALGFGSDALTKGLGDAFGLDTLQFNPSAEQNESALTLGKYLTPDLYVGYGVGLLDTASTFTMKYRLTKRLMFESNTSTAGTGADLTYTLER